MRDGGDVAVWVVAGCLFEVSLPGDEPTRWRWEGGRPEVTLLAGGTRHGRHHFRFRAEAAGSVALRFTRGTEERTVVVRVVPEADLV